MLKGTDERRLERLNRCLEELRAWRNASERTIAPWSFTPSDGEHRHLRPGDFWPVVETPVRFAAEAGRAWRGP
ncbi:MAG: hypothetical protein M3Q10_12300 [Chloroflexota bacterium]|nr:hypothetical protein [Chloroflexota bacterium]